MSIISPSLIDFLHSACQAANFYAPVSQPKLSSISGGRLEISARIGSAKSVTHSGAGVGVVVGLGEAGSRVAVSGAEVGVSVGGAGVSDDCMKMGAGVGFGAVNRPHASNTSDVRTRQVILGDLLSGIKILLWSIQAYSEKEASGISTLPGNRSAHSEKLVFSGTSKISR